MHRPSTCSPRPALTSMTFALARLMRDIYRHHRMDLTCRLFNEKSMMATAQRPDGLTVLHLLGEYGLVFLTELFNLAVARVDIPVIRKNSVIIPILKAGKPLDQGCSYRPIHCSAVKILERLLPCTVKALGTRPSHHGFKQRHFTTLALLSISARVVPGFNQRSTLSLTTC